MGWCILLGTRSADISRDALMVRAEFEIWGGYHGWGLEGEDE